MVVVRRAFRFRSASFCALLLLGLAAGPTAVGWSSEPPVTALAFHPDGQQVVVGSQAGLRIVRCPDLTELRAVSIEATHVHDLRFSPDGTRLAVVGGTPAETGTVAVLRWPNAEPQWQKALDGDLLMAADWRADGLQLAVASLDRSVRVFDAVQGVLVHELTSHSRGVSAVGYLNEAILTSAGLDNSLRVWQLPEAGLVRTMDNHTAAVHDLAVRPNPDPDALPMVVSASDDRTLRLWQPTIGRLVRFLRLEAVPLSVTWTHDGRWAVASCADGRLRIMDPDTAQLVADLPALDGWAYSLAEHPTHTAFVVGGRNGQLQRVVFNEPAR